MQPKLLCRKGVQSLHVSLSVRFVYYLLVCDFKLQLNLSGVSFGSLTLTLPFSLSRTSTQMGHFHSSHAYMFSSEKYVSMFSGTPSPSHSALSVNQSINNKLNNFAPKLRGSVNRALESTFGGITALFLIASFTFSEKRSRQNWGIFYIREYVQVNLWKVIFG